MKRYVMTRNPKRVTIHYPDGSTMPLRHLVHHSPTGIEWGYGGSGPADLARSIVGDVLSDPDPAPHLYQEVKRELVAKLPEQGGEITALQVRMVLGQVESR